MIIHEWKCPVHGEFDGSHPICPAFGCDSEGVVKEIRSPRGLTSDTTRRTDAGLRKTAQSYGLSNLKSAKEGEMSKADNRSNEMLWGDDAKRAMGGSVAAQGLYYHATGANGKQHTTYNSGLMNIASSKTLERVLPPAERTGHLADKK